MKYFEYIRPVSIERACSLLAEANNNAKVIAGGTDLLLQMKKGVIYPKMIVSLRDISDLSFIHMLPDGGTGIGAMTKLRSIEKSAGILKGYSALIEAARQIGSVQIRNRATIGGNLCNASPCADMATVLLAYGATAVITNGVQEREVFLKEFFKGPGVHDLKIGEILKQIIVPECKDPAFAIFMKAGRSQMDISIVSVAVFAVFDANTGKCNKIRIALGSVAPTPIRAFNAENIALGSSLEDTSITRIALAAKEEAIPISDIRASASYRRKLIECLTRKALISARMWGKKGENS